MTSEEKVDYKEKLLIIIDIAMKQKADDLMDVLVLEENIHHRKWLAQV